MNDDIRPLTTAQLVKAVSGANDYSYRIGDAARMADARYHINIAVTVINGDPLTYRADTAWQARMWVSDTIADLPGRITGIRMTGHLDDIDPYTVGTVSR